jgi:predicted NBD/HSP70 family sugar kinase
VRAAIPGYQGIESSEGLNMQDAQVPAEMREEQALPFHRGSNQSGMRAYNERLVLSLVRSHGGLAKMEIARMTGLSAQTVSVIMRALEGDRLLLRGAPVRGRVGQPSVPLSLNPEGAYFFGLKIGRRSADLVLIDFLGRIRAHRHHRYAYPLPGETIDFAQTATREMTAELGAAVERVAGAGIAMPFELWNWADEVGATAHEMDAWRTFDAREALASFGSWPVYLQNDATAACAAELVFGEHSHLRDFVYFYVGTFAGGGVVLNGTLYSGHTGNAGALGSMPVPGNGRISEQLIDQASLVVLERTLRAKGIDTAVLSEVESDWSEFMEEAEAWMNVAARGLAFAIVAAASVIDFQAALIDGSVPALIRTKLVERVAVEIEKIDLQGIQAPRLEAGAIGSIARALGAASLPLFDRYLIDQYALMRAA